MFVFFIVYFILFHDQILCAFQFVNLPIVLSTQGTTGDSAVNSMVLFAKLFMVLTYVYFMTNFYKEYWFQLNWFVAFTLCVFKRRYMKIALGDVYCILLLSQVVS